MKARHFSATSRLQNKTGCGSVFKKEDGKEFFETSSSVFVDLINLDIFAVKFAR